MQRRRWRGRLIAALAGIAMVAPLAACATDAQSPAEESEGSRTLTIASPRIPSTLNPAIGTPGAYQGLYASLAYEPIIRLGADGDTLEPGLATEWEFIDDESRVLELTFREDAAFSDGTPVNAEAIQTYFEYYAENGRSEYIKGATFEVTDEFKLTVTLPAPNTTILQALTDGWTTLGYAISPTALENPDDLGFATAGAGQYMLDPEASISGTELVYVPNPYYYDPDAIHWEKFVVKIIENPSSALSALQSGQVELIAGAGAQQVEPALAAGLQVVNDATQPLMINVGDLSGDLVPALADKRVRQALAHAIDWEAILDAVFDGYGSVNQQLLREGVPGFNPDYVEAYPYDPEKAQELLAAAGYADGFHAGELLVSPGNGLPEMMQAVAAYWGEIGVTVDLFAPPSEIWITHFRNDVYPLWATNGYYSPLPFTINQFYKTDAPYPSRNNPYPELDVARDAIARSVPGSPEAEEAATLANEILVEDALGIFGINVDWIYIASPEIGGITVASPKVTSALDWYRVN